MKSLRPDLVFSYWIYVWYLFYTLKFISFSPKFPLLLGLLDNIVMFVLMILYGTSRETIFYFMIINTLIKIVPLYYLRKESVRLNDIFFTIGLFGLFILWLHINRQHLMGNLKLIYYSLLYGQNKTPFMAFFKYNFKNL